MLSKINGVTPGNNNYSLRNPKFTSIHTELINTAGENVSKVQFAEAIRTKMKGASSSVGLLLKNASMNGTLGFAPSSKKLPIVLIGKEAEDYLITPPAKQKSFLNGVLEQFGIRLDEESTAEIEDIEKLLA